MSDWLTGDPWGGTASNGFDEYVAGQWRSVERLRAITDLFAALAAVHESGCAYGGFEVDDLEFRSASDGPALVELPTNADPLGDLASSRVRVEADVRSAALIALSMMDRRRINSATSAGLASPPGGLEPDERQVWSVVYDLARDPTGMTGTEAVSRLRTRQSQTTGKARSRVRTVAAVGGVVLAFGALVAIAVAIKHGLQPPPTTLAPRQQAALRVDRCFTEPGPETFRQFGAEASVENTGRLEIDVDAARVMLVVSDNPARWQPIEDSEGRDPPDGQVIVKLAGVATEDRKAEQLVGAYAIPANPDGYKQLLRIGGDTAASLVTEWASDRLRPGARSTVGRLIYFVPDDQAALALALVDDQNEILAVASCP